MGDIGLIKGNHTSLPMMPQNYRLFLNQKFIARNLIFGIYGVKLFSEQNVLLSGNSREESSIIGILLPDFYFFLLTPSNSVGNFAVLLDPRIERSSNKSIKFLYIY